MTNPIPLHAIAEYRDMRRKRQSIDVPGEPSAAKEIEVVQKILSGEKYTPHRQCSCIRCHRAFGTIPPRVTQRNADAEPRST